MRRTKRASGQGAGKQKDENDEKKICANLNPHTRTGRSPPGAAKGNFEITTGRDRQGKSLCFRDNGGVSRTQPRRGTEHVAGWGAHPKEGGAPANRRGGKRSTE